MPAPDAHGLKKRWTRLTRRCNNMCLFCLDGDEQDGSIVSAEDILVDLETGLHEGCSQAVLSGGEPTLHPEFFRIVTEAKKMGYARVQVISNGRMFSYQEFLRKAVAAGLDEITFSLHAADPETFEALTRSPKSFEQSIKGFVRAVNTRDLTVSVDIALNAMNIENLRSAIARLIALGASEFDILYPIPFGEAWRNREKVFFDVDAYQREIAEAFEFCEKNGVQAWANRIPASVFEGAERFIQKPAKLLDEVKARKEMFERLANRVERPPCAGERCGLCHVRDFCQSLESFAARISAGTPPSLMITQKNVSRLESPIPFTPSALTLEREELLENLAVKNFLAANEAGVALCLSEPSISDARIPKSVSLVFIEINKKMAAELLVHGVPRFPDAEIKLLFKGRPTLEETLDKDVSISEFFKQYSQRWGALPPTANIPPCIAGGRECFFFSAAPVNVFNNDGSIDVAAFTDFYIESGMRSKSRRCKGCAFFHECPGIHINHIRAFGFAIIPGAMT